MDRYKETFDTWNQVAALYEERFMHLDLYNAGYDRFLSALPTAAAHVLEIGCGPGNISRYLLAQRPELVLQGIDVAPNMVALAAKNNPGARFTVMDCRNIAQLPPGYDGIICGFCLPYLAPSDVTRLLQDCHALLQAGGILYLSFVAGDPQHSGYQSGSSGLRTYFHFHNTGIILTELRTTGFSQLYTERVAYTGAEGKEEQHTIVTARKV